MLLTPVLKSSGERLELDISAEDHLKMKRGYKPNTFYGTITDLKTKKKYKIYSKDCGSGSCYCDAYAVEVGSDEDESCCKTEPHTCEEDKHCICPKCGNKH